VDNPLSLNRYTYVKNNPLRYIDPTGHAEEPTTGGTAQPRSWWEKILDYAAANRARFENLSPKEQADELFPLGINFGGLQVVQLRSFLQTP